MYIRKSKKASIKLIENRIDDLNKIEYPQDVAPWRSRTSTDLEQIFGIGDQSQAIKYLNFTSAISDDRPGFYSSAVSTALGLLNSYIGLIKDHVADDVKTMNNVEQENFQLTLQVAKANQQVADVEARYSQLLVKYNALKDQNERKDTRIEELEGSMLQLENFSGGDIFKILVALPMSNILTILGIVSALTAIVFGLGYFAAKVDVALNR